MSKRLIDPFDIENDIISALVGVSYILIGVGVMMAWISISIWVGLHTGTFAGFAVGMSPIAWVVWKYGLVDE